MTFNELNLSAPLLKAVSEAGYETPSPIQASAIPPVLEGRDLMGCAQTGTGKTAAFALPMLDRLSGAAPRKKGAIRALILTPTRELALQIGESFAAYGKYLKLRSTCRLYTSPILPMAGMPAGGFIVLGVLCAVWRLSLIHI